MGCDFGFEDGVEQGAEGNDRQAAGLDRADEVGIGEHTREGGEHLLSDDAAHGSADGEGGTGAHVDPFFPGEHGLAHGIAAHGQDGAARKEADGRNAGQLKQVQHGLNDDAAADSANSPRHTSKKADEQENYHVLILTFLSKTCRDSRGFSVSKKSFRHAVRIFKL